MIKTREYFLKYEDEEQAITDLLAKGFIKRTEDGVTDASPSIRVIFGIKIPKGEDEEGNPIFVEGCHVNVYSIEPLEFLNDQKPDTPFLRCFK